MARQLSKPDLASKWFFFILVYLFIEYFRPQYVLPIGFMRLGLITTGILVYYLLKSGITLSNCNQTKMIWYFVILTAVYIPFSTNGYWALQTTLNMLLFLPIILSVVICVDSIDRLKNIIDFMIAIMIYISLYSITHNGVGPGSILLDENDVALFINMWLPFCFFNFLIEKEIKKRVFYAIGIAVGVAAVVVSFSRGGFVGLVIVGFVIWHFSERKILSLVLILILGMSVYFYSGEQYLTEMSTVIDENEGTAQARIKTWASGWDMFLDNPLGVGGNNFRWRFPEYQGDRFPRGMGGRDAHSLWITLIAELGIIGIIIYFRLLVHNAKDIFFLKKINIDNNPDMQYIYILSLSFIASSAGFFASGTFISVLYYPHYWYLTAIIVATKRVYVNYKSQELDSPVIPPGI